MRKMITSGFIGLFLVLFVSAFLQAQETDPSLLGKNIREQVQIATQEERTVDDLARVYDTCDQMWLAPTVQKGDSSQAQSIYRDEQEPRRIYFLGQSLQMTSSERVEQPGKDEPDAFPFEEYVNWYDLLKENKNCMQRSAFNFSISVYKEKGATVAAFVEKVSKEHEDAEGNDGISTLDPRNPEDVLITVKYLKGMGIREKITVYRVFSTEDHRLVVVELAWQGAAKNTSSLLNLFAPAIKKAPQAVFADNFISMNCKFGEESYCY